MDRRGKRSITVLQLSVRKWEGLESSEGREEMYVNLMAFPMRA